MEEKKGKSFNYYMRSLHRDLGYFAIGLTIIYALSGIVLLYRNTDFLKKEVKVERQLKPDMPVGDIGNELRMRDFKVTKTEGDIVYFQNGSYNKGSGMVVYTSQEVMFPFNKFIDFHKTISNKSNHWGGLIFCIIFLFLAISSFWMFKANTKTFRRGLILTGVGIVFSIVLLLL